MIVQFVKEECWLAVMLLWERSIRATHHFLDPDDIPIFRDTLQEEYLEKMALYCVRDEMNAIIGVVGFIGDTLELLFVEPTLQGKGIGGILLKFVMNNFGVTKVDVNEENSHAVEFYRRAGFTIKGHFDCEGYPMLHMEL